MENTYWDRKGKYQAELDHLTEMFVPLMGKCSTVAGELVRSATRLAYDFYNNGMGNNTSGAINFLQHWNVIDGDTYRTIYDYSRGQLYQGRYEGDKLQVAIERMMDQTMEFILANPALKTTENTEDMFDYEDEMQHFCEQCDDELDSPRCGYICGSCEELNEYYEYYNEEEECY